MDRFFDLEIPYLIIMLFFLAVTAFVTTRDFMPKVAFKRGMIGVFVIFAVMIGAHYYVTTTRMDGVKKIFDEGKTINCEIKVLELFLSLYLFQRNSVGEFREISSKILNLKENFILHAAWIIPL